MFIDQMEKTKDIIFKANKFFETLSENLSSKEEKLNWFKELMSHIGSVFNKWRELQSDGTIRDHEFDLVYVQQLMSTLSFLVEVFVKEIETQQTFLEARFFILNQMLFCLKGFQDDLLEVKENNEENLLGSFIKLVDYSLDKISDIYDTKLSPNEVRDVCSEAKIIFAELLTHAMVISQISLEDDSKMIKGSCKSVIDALECIVKEIGKQNQTMINLSVQACSDKICILERHVNNGVLKLTLKVFTEYTELLDKISRFCFKFSNAEKPMGEFASLVEKHDFQVDRILQIGLFAVSCSSDKMNAVKIRSCLAILESLETELIPSFSAVLRKQTKQSMNLAILFKELWIRQVALLESFVFKIIDPCAFCQLVFDENKEILSEYCTNLKLAGAPSAINHKSKMIYQNLEPVKKVLAYAKLLLAVTETVKEEYTDGDFKTAYQDFKNVFNEVKWAYVFLKQNNDAPNHAKSWKRCKVLQTTISTLMQHFLKESDELDTSVLSKETFRENWNEGRDPVTEHAFLQHIINRGREILKDRSNLHINYEMNTSLKTIKEITNKKMKEIQIEGLPNGRKHNTTICPTADKEDAIIEDFYEQLETLIKMTKKTEVTLIIGDLNAKVGKGSVDIVGNFGLGTRNERGDRLIHFCQEKQMVITNTYFKLPPRRLYTWKSPADSENAIVRNQIDYIIIPRRYRNAIKSAKTYPGADVRSDHIPLVCKFDVKLQGIDNKRPKNTAINIRKLRNPDIKQQVQETLSKNIEKLKQSTADELSQWTSIKTLLKKPARHF